MWFKKEVSWIQFLRILFYNLKSWQYPVHINNLLQEDFSNYSSRAWAWVTLFWFQSILFIYFIIISIIYKVNFEVNKEIHTNLFYYKKIFVPLSYYLLIIKLFYHSLHFVSSHELYSVSSIPFFVCRTTPLLNSSSTLKFRHNKFIHNTGTSVNHN